MISLLTLLKAIAEPTRLRLIHLLGFGELTVTELTGILNQSQPRISRHLKLLSDAGAIIRFKEGTWAFYRLADDGTAGALMQFLLPMIADHVEEAARDRDRLENVRQKRAEEAARYFEANAAHWEAVRSLYVAEREVESAITAIVGEARVKRLLDIGTGTGRMVQLLADRAEAALGIDQSPQMLAYARTNLAGEDYRHCQFRRADMYDLPCAPSSQDLIILHQVLHFSDEPQRVIGEIGRVLAPGGRAVIIDFAPHREETLRDEHAHRRLGFDRADIDRWARRAGLALGEQRLLDGSVLTVVIWTLTPYSSSHLSQVAAQ